MLHETDRAAGMKSILKRRITLGKFDKGIWNKGKSWKDWGYLYNRLKFSAVIEKLVNQKEERRAKRGEGKETSKRFRLTELKLPLKEPSIEVLLILYFKSDLVILVSKDLFILKFRKRLTEGNERQ